MLQLDYNNLDCTGNYYSKAYCSEYSGDGECISTCGQGLGGCDYIKVGEYSFIDGCTVDGTPIYDDDDPFYKETLYLNDFCLECDGSCFGSMLWYADDTTVIGSNHDSDDCSGEMRSIWSEEYIVGNDCWEYDGSRFAGATFVEVGIATDTEMDTLTPTTTPAPSPSTGGNDMSGAICYGIIVSLWCILLVSFYMM